MTTIDICREIVQEIREMITSSDFQNTHRMKNRFVRKSGKLTMLHVILYLFYTSKQSMAINMDAIKFDLPDIKFPSVTKQALSKARQGIFPSLFKELFERAVDIYYNSIEERKMWHKTYHIFAIDGSRISLPNSKSNFENYGKMFSKKNPSRRWSMALCSTIYDVCNDCIVHGLLEPYLGSERDAALEHFDNIEKRDLFENSILIFDRGYYSEELFRYFADRGYMCVMRIKKKINLAKQCTGDSVLTLAGSKKKGLEDIKVRVIAVPLDSGETEYLATSVIDETLTIEDFKELYFLRWPIESKYDELKNQWLMEEFSGATSTSVEQEFYINLFLSNIAALLKTSADDKIKENARPTNKYDYQANRAYIIARVKWFIPRFFSDTCTIDILAEIPENAYKNRSQIQPGRKLPRNKRNSATERRHFNNRKRAI